MEFYSPAHFCIQQLIDVSAEFDDPAVLTISPRKQEPPVSVEWEAMNATGPVYRLWKTERFLVSEGY